MTFHADLATGYLPSNVSQGMTGATSFTGIPLDQDIMFLFTNPSQDIPGTTMSPFYAVTAKASQAGDLTVSAFQVQMG
jgi:hypothetical protein